MAVSSGPGPARRRRGGRAKGRALGKSSMHVMPDQRRIFDEVRECWACLRADERHFPWAEGVHQLVVGVGLGPDAVAQFRFARDVEASDRPEGKVLALKLPDWGPKDTAYLPWTALRPLWRLSAMELESKDQLHALLERASDEIRRRLGRPGDWRVAINYSGLRDWNGEIGQTQMLSDSAGLPGLPSVRGARARRMSSFSADELMRHLGPAAMEILDRGDRRIWDAVGKVEEVIEQILGPAGASGALDISALDDMTAKRLGDALEPLIDTLPSVELRPLTRAEKEEARGAKHVQS